MNQIDQGQTSSGPLIDHVIKKKRGRPRKDRSLQHDAAVQLPPGFGGAKEHTLQTSDANDGFDPMVGQIVTGIVEGTFDAGYLLNVKIGNSTANLRGLVFKPGRYTPVTPENDIAPHMQMITGNESNTPTVKQGWPQNLNFSTQVRTKRKYTSRRRVSSSHLSSGRGNSVPANLCNKTSNHVSRSPRLMHFGDEDVHEVEPLSVLPPDRSVPVSQLFAGTQASIGQQLSEASGEGESGPFNKGASEVGRNCNGEDDSKSMTEDPRIVSKIEDGTKTLPFSTESLQPANFTNQPLFSYGKGKMTELLQAVQENAKDIQAQLPASSAFGIEVSEAIDIARNNTMKLESSHETRL